MKYILVVVAAGVLVLIYQEWRNGRLLRELRKMMATQGQGLIDLTTQESQLEANFATLSSAATTLANEYTSLLNTLQNPGDSDVSVEAIAQKLAALNPQMTALANVLQTAAAASPTGTVSSGTSGAPSSDAKAKQ
jgi:uncharacterized membrane protein YccC